MSNINVGFIGLGLLGLPMALAFASRGNKVRGFDSNPLRMNISWYPNAEKFTDGQSLEEVFTNSEFEYTSHEVVITHSEIIFVTVQTPSSGGYDGSRPFPDGGVDYDLFNLRVALMDLARSLDRTGSNPVIVIVSTILPGTLRELTRESAFRTDINFVHNPAFSAVGSMISDFLDPEFILIGTDSNQAAQKMKDLYKSITEKEPFVTNPENAEMIKTCYNGFISLKITFANALMELAHKLPGCDVDVVVDCLTLANKRLISPMYLRGGMGDGGGCHPKENAALSHLAKMINLSYDPFAMNMKSRDRQADWIAEIAVQEQKRTQLPICILGTAFKANVNLEEGSSSILLKHMLELRGVIPEVCDPFVSTQNHDIPTEKRVFILATKHDVYQNVELPVGSIVIDPWRFYSPSRDVEVLSIGK